MPDSAAEVVQQALRVGIPKCILRLLVMVAQMQFHKGVGCFDGLEVFAGQRRITKAMMQLYGLHVVPFDKYTVDECMDIESEQGFVLAVAFLLACKPGSLIWLAPVCSSWVFINRATSLRNPLLPAGNTHLPHVKSGNLQAARVAVLIYLAHFLGLTWIVEQPRSSILHCSARFVEILARLPCHRAVAALGAFKAETLKPLWLLSNASWPQELENHRVPWHHKFLVRASVVKVKSGRKTVTGVAKNLKNSQTYTRRFGRAVAALHWKHLQLHSEDGSGRNLLRPLLEKSLCRAAKRLLKMNVDDDMWHDAKLSEVEAFLRGF